MTGFVNVNKAQGVSSAREVSIIKRLSGTPCGHMGTLDPMASGVLPVAIGNAARLFDYFLNKKKEYVASFRFGYTSDTLDTTGVLEQAGSIPSCEQIRQVLPQFVGDISQVPPRYSAKNVGGKRGYMLARAGIDFELPPKVVHIDELELLEQTEEDTFRLRIRCGGGTYIRSLARDIAAALHTNAVMSALCRTASGPFTLEQSVATNLLTPQNLADYIIPTESLLPYRVADVSKDCLTKLLNGLTVPTDYDDGLYKIYAPNGTFYGLVEACGGNLRIRTKLC